MTRSGDLQVRRPSELGVAQVLLVCRANQCRSPFAAEIAQRRAQGSGLRFSSAGLLPGGHPMPATGIRVGKRLGMDFTSHLSRRVDVERAGEFDVILTMGRDQARDLVADNPGLWPRVFTVKQFDRWLTGRRVPRGVELASWLGSSAGQRSRLDLIGADPLDDVADPITRPARAWRRMVVELELHLTHVVEALAPAFTGAGTRSS